MWPSSDKCQLEEADYIYTNKPIHEWMTDQPVSEWFSGKILPIQLKVTLLVKIYRFHQSFGQFLIHVLSYSLHLPVLLANMSISLSLASCLQFPCLFLPITNQTSRASTKSQKEQKWCLFRGFAERSKKVLVQDVSRLGPR